MIQPLYSHGELTPGSERFVGHTDWCAEAEQAEERDKFLASFECPCGFSSVRVYRCHSEALWGRVTDGSLFYLIGDPLEWVPVEPAEDGNPWREAWEALELKTAIFGREERPEDRDVPDGLYQLRGRGITRDGIHEGCGRAEWDDGQCNPYALARPELSRVGEEVPLERPWDRTAFHHAMAMLNTDALLLTTPEALAFGDVGSMRVVRKEDLG